MGKKPGSSSIKQFPTSGRYLAIIRSQRVKEWLCQNLPAELDFKFMDIPPEPVTLWPTADLFILDEQTASVHPQVAHILKQRNPRRFVPILLVGESREEPYNWRENGFDKYLSIQQSAMELESCLGLLFHTREVAYRLAQESEDLFRTLVEHSLVGVYLIQHGKFTYVNEALARIFGYRASELVNRLGPIDLTHSDDRELVLENIRRRIAGEVPLMRYTFKGVRKDGTEIMVEVLGSEIKYRGEPSIIGTLMDITEKQKAGEERRKYIARLENLRKLEEAILSAESLESLVRIALSHLKQVLGCDGAVVIRTDANWTWGYSLGGFAPDGYRPAKGRKIPLIGYGNIKKLRANQIVRKKHLQGRKRLHKMEQVIKNWGLDAYLVIPLQIESKSLGFIGVGFRRSEDLTQEVEDLLKEVSHPLAIALNQAHLRLERDRAAHRLEIVAQVGRNLVRMRDFNTLCRKTNEIIAGLMDSPNFGIFLYDQEKQLLIPRYLSSDKQVLEVNDLPSIPLEPDTGIQSKAVTTRKPVIVHDLDRLEPRPRTFKNLPSPSDKRVRSIMVVPLLKEERVLGTLQIQSYEPEAYSDEDALLLEGIAGEMVLAIENIEYLETIERHARELEIKVAERTADLQEAMAELEAFAYSVAHDLRAPLRSIAGFSQILLRDFGKDLDREGQRLLRTVNASAQHMDNLIRDLLAYSRLPYQEIPLSTVSLERVLNQVLNTYKRQVEACEARISRKGPFPLVHSNEMILTQVLGNLIDNALKFVPPERRPKIKIWCEDLGERVRLWVEDNGIGIAPEHRERIFKVFERLHGRGEYSGTGVGLAIVKRGLRRVGGEVGVESTLGKGSQFWITLPKAVTKDSRSA